MAETNPKNIFIGMIFAAIILISGIGLMSHVFSDNPDSATGFDKEGFNNTMNYYNELQDNIDNLEGNFTRATAQNVGILGAIGNLIQVAWTSITQMFGTIGLMSNFMSGIAFYLGLPTWLPSLLFSVILIIVIIWAVILIFRS